MGIIDLFQEIIAGVFNLQAKSKSMFDDVNELLSQGNVDNAVLLLEKNLLFNHRWGIAMNNRDYNNIFEEIAIALRDEGKFDEVVTFLKKRYKNETSIYTGDGVKFYFILADVLVSKNENVEARSVLNSALTTLRDKYFLAKYMVNYKKKLLSFSVLANILFEDINPDSTVEEAKRILQDYAKWDIRFKKRDSGMLSRR